jgi:cyclopropane fatty-acyl-phospholipid synthase-like methyltransferase
MSGWEGDNTPRLIELVGGDINEDLESLKTRTIEAYKYRFDKFICDRDVVLDFGSGLGFGSEAFTVSKYVCADISQSMLSRIPADVEHVEIGRNDLSALHDYTFTKIISHAVFVHLEIPEVVYYLKQFKSILAQLGEVIFTYKNLDLLDVNDPLFLDHTDRLMRNREFQTRSISYISPSAIKHISEQLGYKYVDADPSNEFDKTARLINERMDI